MKSLIILFACLVSVYSLPVEVVAPTGVDMQTFLQERGIFDFIINLFGLEDVWFLVQEAGSDAVGKLLGDLSQIVFKGQAAIAQAVPIIQELVNKLKNHTVTSVQAVAQAIADLTAILAGNPNSKVALLANGKGVNPTKDLVQRGIFDFVINTFGLGSVWEQIQAVGTSAVAKLINELTQVVLSGQATIENARPIIQNLIEELKNHTVSSTQAVFQAISDLAAIVAGNPNTRSVFVPRGIFDFIINTFGLGSVWEQIQAVGVTAVAKLLGELSQIVVLGKGALDLARPIIKDLIEELKNHTVSSTQAVFQAISELKEVIAGLKSF